MRIQKESYPNKRSKKLFSPKLIFSKKAIEIQFNWMFVLVAGALILMFFMAIVFKQKEVSQESTNIAVLKSIGAIIAGAGTSSQTSRPIDVPYSDILVGCNQISSGRMLKQFGNASLILFAPGLIRGKKLIVQTLDFAAPYKATNILYATSPSVRYVIIGNGNLARDVNKTFSRDIGREFYTAPFAVRNKNDYKVRFVFFSDAESIVLENLNVMRNEDVSAISIAGSDDKGEIKFYQKNSLNGWTLTGKSDYITRPSVIGAIFADTIEAYDCNMQNIFQRFEIITRIYKQRASKLLGYGAGRCDPLYNAAIGEMEKILASKSFGKDSIEQISKSSSALSENNNNLQLESCPLPY